MLCLVTTEPKEVDPTKAPKKEEAVEEKKEPEPEKKLSAAEYRRLHPFVITFFTHHRFECYS